MNLNRAKGYMDAFKKVKDFRNRSSCEKPSLGCTENIIRPVTLFGVLAPSMSQAHGEDASECVLVSYGGVEYTIVTGDEWKQVLPKYFWEEVKVIGLLNVREMTVVPQKVYPKGPTGENVIDLASRKGRELIKQIMANTIPNRPAAAWSFVSQEAA